MFRRSALALLVALIVSPFAATSALAQGKWDAAMKAFEEADAKSPTPRGGTVFVGSSSIRLWKLDQSFPNSGYLNRGFGGSEIADSIEHIETLVLKHKPRVVVMYAGDNDIAKKKSPETVANDFATFAARLHESLPQTKLFYIAVKPSIKRWNLITEVNAANALIANKCASDPNLIFVDIATPMLGDDGKPRPELFVEDGLHMSPAGYEIWTAALLEKFKAADCRD